MEICSIPCIGITHSTSKIATNSTLNLINRYNKNIRVKPIISISIYKKSIFPVNYIERFIFRIYLEI